VPRPGGVPVLPGPGAQCHWLHGQRRRVGGGVREPLPLGVLGVPLGFFLAVFQAAPVSERPAGHHPRDEAERREGDAPRERAAAHDALYYNANFLIQSRSD
jgi:hypothetical protein